MGYLKDFTTYDLVGGLRYTSVAWLSTVRVKNVNFIDIENERNSRKEDNIRIILFFLFPGKLKMYFQG